jgi:NADPH:quinone reductase-like Zn-dependent oxidoreductase
MSGVHRLGTRATARGRLLAAGSVHDFGGPGIPAVVDIAEPEAGPGKKLRDVAPASVNHAASYVS